MQMERRDFLKVSAASALGLALAGPAAAKTPPSRNGMPYRSLGKTGVDVSLLCLGGYHIGVNSLTDEEAVRLMRTAVDEGVNFFDNAWQYNNGRSEERMGLALKDGYREKVFLMTKHKSRDRASAQKHLEDSLRRLQVDVIDLWQFHEVCLPGEPEGIYNGGPLEYALEAKAQGKIRFIGFTGHNLPGIHKETIERGFAWDTVQLPINVYGTHFRPFEDVLPIANKKGIGIIAMKSMAGGPILKTKGATAEECLRYTMSQPVSAVCSGMDSLDILKQNLALAKNFKPMEKAEIAALLERTKPFATAGEHEWYKAKDTAKT